MLKQLAIVTGFGILSANANSQAYEGKIKYGKTEEPAIIMVYDYPKETVLNAFNAFFTDKNLAGSRNKGFYAYQNTVISDVSRSKLDYSFKFEESGKTGAEKTTVYMVMQAADNVNDAGNLSGKGKSFLEDMLKDVKRSNTVIHIRKQEEVLVDEETKLGSLQKSQKELEEKLEKNKQEQETQQKIIASQKMMLDDLKKGNN